MEFRKELQIALGILRLAVGFIFLYNCNGSFMSYRIRKIFRFGQNLESDKISAKNINGWNSL